MGSNELKKLYFFISGRFLFTIAYTLVILPFTVGFFKDIASPSSNTKLFQFLSLAKVHEFFLPLFLGALEFASIVLAISFWEWQGKQAKRILILVLFILCQSYAVFSVFYDIRGNEFKEIESKREEQEEREAKKIAEEIEKRRESENRKNEILNEKYKAEKEIYEKDVDRLEKDIGNKKQAIKEVEDQIRVLENQIKIDESSKSKTEESIHKIQLELRSQKNAELDHLRKQVSNDKENIKEIERKIEQPQQLLQKKFNWTVDEKSINKQIQNLKQEKVNLQNSIGKNENSIQQLLSSPIKDSELDRLKVQVENKTKQIDQSREQLRKLQDKILELQNEIDRLGKWNIKLPQPVQWPDPNSGHSNPGTNTQSDNILSNTAKAGIETKIEYIVQNLIITNSAFAAFVAILFPISVFAIGFVLARKEWQKGSSPADFSLEQELDKGSGLSKEQQFEYVKSLEPAILAYLTGLKCANNIAEAATTLQSKYEYIIQIVKVCSSFKDQIMNSKLDADVKGNLTNYIDKLINDLTLSKNSKL